MRDSKDSHFLQMAKLVATQGTCYRRQVGCVLVNSRNHVLATGYNGVAAGMPHCNDIGKMLTVDGAIGEHEEAEYPNRCNGSHSPSGTNLDACQAIHAEQNALLQCKDVYAIKTAYVTAAPCVHCIKLLLNTSCERIVYLEDYPHAAVSQKLWMQAGRKWERFVALNTLKFA